MKFFIQRIRKVNFFIKNPKSNQKKKNSSGWEVRGWGVARVSVFFLFSKESKSEKNVFFLRG